MRPIALRALGKAASQNRRNIAVAAEGFAGHSWADGLLKAVYADDQRAMPGESRPGYPIVAGVPQRSVQRLGAARPRQ
jgi:hypothetical protein